MARIANRMQEATNRLMSRLLGYASVTITYSRGANSITNITATVGRTPYDVVQGEVMIAHESRDYMIDKCAIAPWIPANGDRITEEDGRVYEVSMPKPFNVYESIGPEGLVLKIHTIGKSGA